MPSDHPTILILLQLLQTIFHLSFLKEDQIIYPAFVFLRKIEKQKVVIPAASIIIATAGVFLVITCLAGYEF